MKTIDIVGANHFEKWTKRRSASRGIITKGGKILLCYEEKIDQFSIPGGGIEKNESFEACCIREIAEEMGLIASANNEFLITNDYYEEYQYETHFFSCEIKGETVKMFTEGEIKRGLVPKWIDLSEALAIFSKHQDYAETNEEKRGTYLREYLALKAFIEQCQ